MQSITNWSTPIDSPTLKHKYQTLIDRLHVRLVAARSKFDRRLVQQLTDELTYLQNQV